MEPAECLNYFLSLARNGVGALAPPMAHSAYRLAVAVLDDVPTLDDQTLRGMVVFAAVALNSEEHARNMLDSTASVDV